MYDLSLNGMLKRGFAQRKANEFRDILLREDNNPIFDADFRAWAHSLGFAAESASAFNLTEDNVDNYLPDYEYARVWPLNDWERIWINDKLTFKYMFIGTEFEQYLPE